jgi:hypothetical protein
LVKTKLKPDPLFGTRSGTGTRFPGPFMFGTGTGIFRVEKKKREKLELEPGAITVPVQVTQTGLELGLIFRTGTKFFCRSFFCSS